jgi:hypothetical protein
MGAAPEMSFVSHMVLGAPILLTHCGLLQTSQCFPPLPETARRKGSVGPEGGRDACMLLPRGAEFFSLVVDRVGGVYVKPQGGGERIYCIQPQFAALARLLPGDSACRAIAYAAGAAGGRGAAGADRGPSGALPSGAPGAPVLGVYDLTRLEGRDLGGRGVLERHALLQDTVALNARQFEEHAAREGRAGHAGRADAPCGWSSHVCVHWVGWQEACVGVLHSGTELPFQASHICRLDEDEYVKMLAPVRTAWPFEEDSKGSR